MLQTKDEAHKTKEFWKYSTNADVGYQHYTSNMRHYTHSGVAPEWFLTIWEPISNRIFEFLIPDFSTCTHQKCRLFCWSGFMESSKVTLDGLGMLFHCVYHPKHFRGVLDSELRLSTPTTVNADIRHLRSWNISKISTICGRHPWFATYGCSTIPIQSSCKIPPEWRRKFWVSG